jgi:serine/threonine protein kinase
MMEIQFVENDDYPEGNPRCFKTFGNPHIDNCRTYDTNIFFRGTVCLGRIIEPTTTIHQSDKTTVTSGVLSDSDDDDDDESQLIQPEPSEFAFWFHREIGTSHFGSVYSGMVIKRVQQRSQTDDGNFISWEATGQVVAIKEYNRDIMRSQGLFAENPFSEIAAMQYLLKYQQQVSNQQRQGQGQRLDKDFFNVTVKNTKESHVMMPFGAYCNHSYIYTLMPHANGGDLFNALHEDKNCFTEDEARYWMHQILRGIDTLQKAGVCHRDISLENLLTDTEGRALIIDMGMSIKIPFFDDEDYHTNEDSNDDQRSYMDHRRRQRCLINPTGMCGKVSY